MPTSTLPHALSIIAFWALVIVARVVALLLAFRGAAALLLNVVYMATKGGVVLFQPRPVGSRSLLSSGPVGIIRP